MTSLAPLLPRALLPPLDVPEPGTPARAEDLILPPPDEEMRAARAVPQPLRPRRQPPEFQVEGIQEPAKGKQRDQALARRLSAELHAPELVSEEGGEGRPGRRGGLLLLEGMEGRNPADELAQALAGSDDRVGRKGLIPRDADAEAAPAVDEPQERLRIVRGHVLGIEQNFGRDGERPIGARRR